MTSKYFDGNTIDVAKHAHILAKPAATKTIVIFFTPRSGSSWLTDILAQTKVLGRANELFNPNFLPKSSAALQADTLDAYIEAARRQLNVGGVFSFEVTMHQLRAVFDSEDDFHDRFRNSTFVWLTRRDIVAQAVSLAKMVETKVAHSPYVTDDELISAEEKFEYSDSGVKRWIEHILHAEKGTEAYFRKHNVTPLRLVYESMVDEGAPTIAEKIASEAGVHLNLKAPISETHQKIATSLNAEFAQRFRRRHPFFLRGIEWKRRRHAR